MAVSLRLARQGSKKRPFYRIVAAESRSPRDGRFIEQIGYYDPRRKQVKVRRERYQHWVERGARPSPTVASLVKRHAKEEESAASS